MLTVIVFMGSKVNGKTPSLFGYSVLRVSTGSMQPELMIGDVILGKSVDNPTALKVGDIITYRGSGQTEGLLVTHKVVVAPYKTADGTYKLQTKGIANDAPDLKFQPMMCFILWCVSLDSLTHCTTFSSHRGDC